jgi:hypothetical protein
MALWVNGKASSLAMYNTNEIFALKILKLVISFYNHQLRYCTILRHVPLLCTGKQTLTLTGTLQIGCILFVKMPSKMRWKRKK